MKRVRIKFCGITSLDDAINAVRVGADAIGFVFYKKSPRYVSPEQVERIVAEMPPFISTVGVFVNEDMSFIEEYVHGCGLTTVQLHGDEDVRYCSDFKKSRFFKEIKLIKAIRMKDEESLEELEDCHADAFLLDTYKEEERGGTGKGFDRALATLAKEYGRNIIISGGLNPDNVYKIVKSVEPYGVDVSSGIESSPGRKNLELMEQFIREVRRAEKE